MKLNLGTTRSTSRFMVGTALAAVATASQAQIAGGPIGSGMGNGICRFIQSPIIAIVAAIAILAVAFMLILNEGKGLGGWVVRIVIGIAIIMSIGTVIGWLGLTQSIGC